MALVAPNCGGGFPPAHATKPPDPADAPLCQLEHVADGDTVDVMYDGTERTLRLNCIDAPETGQSPWGERTTRAGIGEPVRVVSHGQGPNGRAVAMI